METIYFSPAELADKLGVTRETIYKGIKSGAIPSYKIGRLRRISNTQFEKAIAAQNEVI
jgi:excisionase family DNA binding protein